MSQMPTLFVAPLEEIKPHEDFDPFRVDRLKSRIDSDGTQHNPMVCTMAPDGSFVLLDGATRREAFSRLGLPHAVVQVVDPDAVRLDTWHHVLHNGDPGALRSALERNPVIKLTTDTGTPRINIAGTDWHTIEAVDVSNNTALNALVDSYHGQLTVTRVTNPSAEAVSKTHVEWVAIVEFPSLTVEDVMVAATETDFVPAGITRFVVPERALRLNITLDFLREEGDTKTKQDHLDEILMKRAREGRIRRYDEPVVILDD